MSWTGIIPNSSFKVDVDNLHHVRRLSTLINSEFTQPTTVTAEGLLPSIPYRNSRSTLFGVQHLEGNGDIPQVRQHSTKPPPRASSSYSTGITVGYDERLQHNSHLHRRTSLTTEAKSNSVWGITDFVHDIRSDGRFHPNPHVSAVPEATFRQYPPLASDSIFSDPAALCYCAGFLFPPAFLLGAISRPPDDIKRVGRKLKSPRTVKEASIMSTKFTRSIGANDAYQQA